jgi:predicted nucleic acid-binding protein
VKITLDLNVLLDVAQKREPHFDASYAVIEKARCRELHGILPAHAITTLHYVIERSAGTQVADSIIDDLLAHFTVHPVDTKLLVRARKLSMADFEDSVVAAVAEATGSDYIVTRNLTDFANSPVRPINPANLIRLIGGTL